MSKIIPMMFCFDENYATPAAVAFYSLLDQHQAICKEKDIYFKLYVVHNGIPQNTQEKLRQTINDFDFATLEFINGNQYLQDAWNAIEGKNHFALEVLYKLITPSLFPQYEKIIISDVDAVFVGSVLEEFERFDINEEYWIGGVVSNNPQDFYPIPKKGYRSGYLAFSKEDQKKIQHGIDGAYVLINLKKWREHNVEELATKTLFKYAQKLVLAEQDVLALTCYPHIKKISMQYALWHGSWNLLGENFAKLQPNIYSKEEIAIASSNPIQIHYACGAKPWNTPSEPKSEIWFSYLAKTPFLGDFLNKVEELILQKHYRASWKYQFHKMLKNPKILLQLSTYKKVLDKLF